MSIRSRSTTPKLIGWAPPATLGVLGLRFSADKMAPAERFRRLRDELRDHFVAIEIDSSAGDPDGYRKGAHSVLTEDLRDEPESATRAALEQVLELFRTKLLLQP
jgi:dienelactone hydrolase